MKVIVKQKENGNIVFSFKPIQYKDRLWILIVIELYFLIQFIYWLQKPEFFWFAFFSSSITAILIWGLTIEKMNKKVIRKNALNLLDDKIKRDIESIDNSLIELERNYKNIENDKMNLEDHFVDVLLSDGRQLRYRIIMNIQFERTRVFEIDVNYTII